jgi:hypothetical protein
VAKITGLAREQLGALAELNRINLGEHFYLGGGSGVAAHLRHRCSIDLDLFSRRPDADLSRLGAKVTERIEDTQVVSATDVTLTIRAGKLAVDIVRYPYAVLEQPVPGPSGFPLASLLDLAAMKLSAVTKRGIRRDFWDLHEQRCRRKQWWRRGCFSRQRFARLRKLPHCCTRAGRGVQ